MKTVLVSVISGQTIPNFLLMKELKGQFDSQIFITTYDMEGRDNPADSKSIWIEKAAGIEPGSTRRIVVIEDSWQDISAKLHKLDVEPENRYIVNLTGGTKIMTLAVFEYFAQPGNTIYYIPFPKNEYHGLYPDRNISHKLKYRCNLKEYLMAHGLYFSQKDELITQSAETIQFFEKVRKENFEIRLVPEIAFSKEMLDKGKRAYYSGGWFEEYVYLKLKEIFKLPGKNIAMGVKLFRNPNDPENDNEYDVMYIRRNTLYIIECKVINANNLKNKLDGYMYKLGAITKDFGLKVNTYLVILNNIETLSEEIRKNIEKKKRILGLKAIIDQNSFKSQNHFEKMFN